MIPQQTICPRFADGRDVGYPSTISSGVRVVPLLEEYILMVIVPVIDMVKRTKDEMRNVGGHDSYYEYIRPVGSQEACRRR